MASWVGDLWHVSHSVDVVPKRLFTLTILWLKKTPKNLPITLNVLGL